MGRIRLPFVPLPQSAVTQTHVKTSDGLGRLWRNHKDDKVAETASKLGFPSRPARHEPSAIANLGFVPSPSGHVIPPPGPPQGMSQSRRSGSEVDLWHQFQTLVQQGDALRACAVWKQSMEGLGGHVTSDGDNIGRIEPNDSRDNRTPQSAAPDGSDGAPDLAADCDAKSTTSTLSPPDHHKATVKLLNMLISHDATHNSTLAYNTATHLINNNYESASIYAPPIFRVCVALFQNASYAQVVTLWRNYVAQGCLVGTRTTDYHKFVAVVAPAFILSEFESRGSREGAAADLYELLGPQAPVLPVQKIGKMLRKLGSPPQVTQVVLPKYIFFADMAKVLKKSSNLDRQINIAVSCGSAHQLGYWFNVAKRSRDTLSVASCRNFLQGYVTLKNPVGAFSVWEYMERHNLSVSRDCWEALLKAASLVTTSQSQYFTQAWDGMILAGYPPSPSSYASKFEWLRKNRMFMSADQLFGDIVDAKSYSQDGLPELTQEIFQSYIQCLLQKKRFEEAEQLVQLLTPREGLSVTSSLAKAFVEIYLKQKLVDKIPPWLTKMEHDGLFTTPETFALLVAYNVMYITEVAPERPLFPVLKQIYSQMEAQKIPLSQQVFGRLVAENYRVCPQTPGARAIFDSMVRLEIVPSTEVVMAVLRGECSKRGDVLLGQELLHSMQAQKGVQKLEYWNYLIRALLKQGFYSETLQSVDRMRALGMRLSAQTYTLLLEGLPEEYSEQKQAVLDEMDGVKEPAKTYMMTDRLKKVVRELKSEGVEVGGLLGSEAPVRWR